jgi:flagellar biosynthetic protein FliQ
MNEADAIDLAHQTIWTILVMSGPSVLCCMIAGIVVAVFQALTQVQEATLTFVPKALAIFGVLALGGSWTGSQLILFTQQVYSHIASGFAS